MPPPIRPSKIVKYDDRAEIVILYRDGIEKCRAIIDLCDVPIVKRYRWCVGHKNHVKTTIFKNKKWKAIYLHRMLMGLKKGDNMIDHIDRNPLNNRRKNIRVSDYGQNRANCKISKNNISGKTGVFMRPSGKWEASIRVNKKKIYLTETSDKDKAIRLRQEAELKYHGVVDSEVLSDG